MQRNTAPSRGNRGRGQTAVIAIVLLVGVVAIGSIGILLFGANATTQSQDRAEQERIQQSFRQLDSNIDSVARSEATSRSTDLDLPDDADSAVREDAAGNIWINRTNFTTGTTDVLVNQSIGAVRYTSDNGETVAYQAGGVWRQSGNQTVMLSPPAFAYKFNRSGEEPTLTIPIIVTSGPERLNGGDISITKNRSIAPTNNVTIVEGDLVTVKIRSQWYVGWAEYFREIATEEEGVDVDHGNNTATLELIVPASRQKVDAIVAGAQGQDVEFDQSPVIDNYNSSTGSGYDGGNGTTMVVVAGDLELSNKATVDGDVVVGEDVVFNNPDSNVTGNASYGNDLIDDSGSVVPPGDSTQHVGGWHNDNASLIEYEPVDGIIDARVAAVQDENNNSPAPITGNRLDGCSSECHLYPGAYYLEEIDFGNGDRLVIHATDTVSIVVNGTVSIDGDGDPGIEVRGGGRVNVYINSEDSTQDDLFIKQADVIVPNERSPQMWFYMDKNANAEIRNGQTKFVGVLFGPGEGDTEDLDGTDIEISQKANVYGAFVGDVNRIGQNVAVHYDEALRNSETVTNTARVPRLTFLHASLYEVCVQPEHNGQNCDGS